MRQEKGRLRCAGSPLAPLRASPAGARLQCGEERNEGIFGTHFESSAFIQLWLENPQTCVGEGAVSHVEIRTLLTWFVPL